MKKRTRNYSGTLRRTMLPPNVEKALQKYVKRQEVPPSVSAVLLASLTKYLVQSGDLVL